MKNFLSRICILLIIGLYSTTVDEPVNFNQKVQPDQNMKTEKYQTDITLMKNGSYSVKEAIDVNFVNPRHGIYRNIPVRGKQYYIDEKNREHEFLYYADVKMEDANTTAQYRHENGNIVMQFGDREEEVNAGTYRFSYLLTPYHQEKDYHNIYYNVLPGQWRNPLPKGSSFTIHFPKKVNLSKLKFYCGEQGQTRDARDAAHITIDETGRKVTGVLKKDLPLGWGITCFGSLGEGYFTSVTHPSLGKEGLLTAAFCITVLILLFLNFGRDEEIISSIQYQPPEDIDSAAIGYIIDGKANDQDVISLLLYWADQGYVFIKEEEEGVTVYKLKDLPPYAPEYQTYFFGKLFTEDEPFISTQNIPDRMTGAVEETGKKLKKNYEDLIYTGESRAARWIGVLLAITPLAVFMISSTQYGILSETEQHVEMSIFAVLSVGFFLIIYVVDYWYSLSDRMRQWIKITGCILCGGGLVSYIVYYMSLAYRQKIFDFTGTMFIICGITAAGFILTAFMKKRTKQCTEWMGYLAGFRDFIETAELDRMKVLGEEHPNLFYHIFPYAYVFGLSEIYAEKLEALNVEMPVWFESYGRHLTFQYQSFQKFSTQMNNSIGSYSSSGSSGSGSGGSSGGGFGGGGGGSW
ncbi:DUF2207 domain-containing protein [Anaerostipes sp.]|uniref:DUF2207 domain-containing protein n=1 Tax=Anaerostipes sp. TaxID=1872530 RepID=UPI0025C1D319|nr:DUF2207 domain-containing protein [Anaerostipes sp.]MBS7009088.1 DUF2207 domain-containing protein [Anaerostipes sp.]